MEGQGSNATSPHTSGQQLWGIFRWVSGVVYVLVGAALLYMLYDALGPIVEQSEIPFQGNEGVVGEFWVISHVHWLVGLLTFLGGLGILLKKRFGWILMIGLAAYWWVFAIEMLILAGDYLPLVTASLGGLVVLLYLAFVVFAGSLAWGSMSQGRTMFRITNTHFLLAGGIMLVLLLWQNLVIWVLVPAMVG